MHNKDGKSLRSLDGWTDCGCANLSAAARNRRRVANAENIDAYLVMERWLTSHRGKLIPAEFLGSLPQVGRHDSVPYYMHEEEVITADLTGY